MSVSMTIIVDLYNGEQLTLKNVNARLIQEIETIIENEECFQLEIRNMDTPKKSIEFYLSDLKEIRFE